MKKALVVGESDVLRLTISAVVKEWFKEVMSSGHNEALLHFATEEPSHIIILDCDPGQAGEKAVADIKRSATGQNVIQCGFGKSADNDYIQLPFRLEELKKKLKN
ncbi:MAG: response regulator [Patescibacteria group bacterium]